MHINGEDERVHLQWFDHAPNTFLDDIADPRELFLAPLCDTLPLVSLCGTVPVADFSARTSVPDDYDGYFFRFAYDKTDASFTEPLPAPPATDPPHNCAVCARREEEQIEAHGRIVRRDGGVVGVAVHGTTFHIGDFALVRAEAGPSRIAQLVGVFSSDPVLVKLQLLGRVSDLADLLPPDELRDEVRLPPLHAYISLWPFTASFVLYERVRGSASREPTRAVLRAAPRPHLRYGPLGDARPRALLLPLPLPTAAAYIVGRTRVARRGCRYRVRDVCVCPAGAARRGRRVRGGSAGVQVARA